MRVINSHPLSELFIDWVAASRQRLAEDTELRRKDALDDEAIEPDMGTPVYPRTPQHMITSCHEECHTIHVDASKSWALPLDLCESYIPPPLNFLAHSPAFLFRLRLDNIQYTLSVDAFWYRR